MYTIQNQAFQTIGYRELNQTAQEPIAVFHNQRLVLNMDNTLTPNIKVHSSSDVRIHSNWPDKRKSMTMSFDVNRMAFGTLVIYDAKDRFVKIQDDQVMVIKLHAAMNKVSFSALYQHFSKIQKKMDFSLISNFFL